jgi:hypothetical protein
VRGEWWRSMVEAFPLSEARMVRREQREKEVFFG